MSSTNSGGSNSSSHLLSDYDVAIIGGGIAGLSAGIAAAESGANPVVLEKAPEERRGGHLQYTETFRIPTADVETDLDFHIPDYSSSDFYQDIMHVTDGFADPDLAQTLVTSAGSTFDWLSDHLTAQGFVWQTEPDRTMYAAGRIFHDGPQITDRLYDAAEAAGVDVLYEAEARELIQEGTTSVAGVRAVVSGRWTEIEAGSVILACGGYESSPEKRATYYGGPYDEITVRGSRYNTGEALDLALEAGAASAGQWSGAHMTLIDSGSPPVEGGQTLVSGYQYGIILNHDGERFLDEGEDTRAHTYAKFGRKVFEQPYREAFIIQDATTNDYVLHTGPTKPITANSIEELVSRLGIEEEERAIETFEEYNEACDSNVELDPSVLDGNQAVGISPEKSNWAKQLTDTPLVAYPVTGGITFAFGGVEQTTEAEVLDTSENPIPGFYAAGNATGGLFYNNYPGGSGLTNAAVYGKIAGENAAAFALGEQTD